MPLVLTHVVRTHTQGEAGVRGLARCLERIVSTAHLCVKGAGSQLRATTVPRKWCEKIEFPVEVTASIADAILGCEQKSAQTHAEQMAIASMYS